MQEQKESILKKLYSSFEFGIATAISFFVGMHITLFFHGSMPIIGGLWVAISAIIVLQDTKDVTNHFAYVRIVGSFIGALVSAISLAVLPVNVFVIFFIVFLAVFVCEITNFKEGLRLAALSVAIIIAVSIADPSVNYIINCTARFIESCCGSFIAIIIRLVTHYGANYLTKK